MIFDQTVNIGKMVAYRMLTTSNGVGGNTVKILVYSGAQPTIADFVSNWSFLYYLVPEDEYNYSPAQPATFGSSLLAGYGQLTATSASYGAEFLPVYLTSGATGITSGSNTNAITLNTSNGTAGKFYFQNGTASWAAIFFEDKLGGLANPFNAIPLEQNSTASFENTPFIIAPVTSLTGNGTVRLSSTSVAGAAPDLGDVYLAFNLS